MSTTTIENFTSAFPAASALPYAKLRSTIRFGDILLCSGYSPFSQMIQQTTQSVWSHVGFIIQ